MFNGSKFILGNWLYERIYLRDYYNKRSVKNIRRRSVLYLIGRWRGVLKYWGICVNMF